MCRHFFLRRLSGGKKKLSLAFSFSTCVLINKTTAEGVLEATAYSRTWLTVSERADSSTARSAISELPLMRRRGLDSECR